MKNTIQPLALISFFLLSPVTNADYRIQESIPGSWRTSYEELPISATENMGLIGVHYDLHLFKDVPSLYLGIGGYGSVKGEEGGFYTSGLTLGWKPVLFGKVKMDLGAHLGGGGGSDRAFPGGGMIVRTHAGLETGNPVFNFRLGVAHTSFSNSRSAYKEDTHVYAGIGVRSNSWRDLGGRGVKDARLFSGKVRRLNISPTILYYMPDDEPITRTGGYTGSGSTNKNIPMLGIQIDRHISRNAYVMLEAYGAGGGGADGYATYFTGIGYTAPFSSSLAFDAKFLIGLGGDGRLDTGGGLMLQPMAGLRWKIFPHISLKAMLGRAIAPDGRLRATAGEFSVTWSADKPIAGGSVQAFSSKDFKTIRWTSSLSHKTYLPKSNIRNTGGMKFDDQLHLLGLVLSTPLTESFSFNGSTHWAYEGNIGSYAEGLFGFVYKPAMFAKSRISPVVQYDVGVAGGGDMNVDGGVIHQFKLGASYRISKKVSLDIYAGRMQSSSKSFVGDVASIQLNWQHFSLFRK
jgi:hypothetical protein